MSFIHSQNHSKCSWSFKNKIISHVAAYNYGLLNLNSSLHLRKILKKRTTEGMWVFEWTYLLCDFLTRFLTEGSKYFIKKWQISSSTWNLHSSCKCFLNFPRGCVEFKWSCPIRPVWKLSLLLAPHVHLGRMEH